MRPILEGIRVLDVGSGAGHVAFLAAELVGPSGEVLGVERAPEALARARDGAAMRGLANLSVLQADLEDLAPVRPFDAVVGRMVLLFVPDPTATLRRLARQLRPAGIVFFQELDMGGLRTWPARPLLDRCRDDVVTTSRRAGVNTRMGLDLYSTYVAAGLPSPTMRLDAIVGGGADFPGPALVV